MSRRQGFVAVENARLPKSMTAFSSPSAESTSPSVSFPPDFTSPSKPFTTTRAPARNVSLPASDSGFATAPSATVNDSHEPSSYVRSPEIAQHRRVAALRRARLPEDGRRMRGIDGNVAVLLERQAVEVLVARRDLDALAAATVVDDADVALPRVAVLPVRREGAGGEVVREEDLAGDLSVRHPAAHARGADAIGDGAVVRDRTRRARDGEFIRRDDARPEGSYLPPPPVRGY